MSEENKTDIRDNPLAKTLVWVLLIVTVFALHGLIASGVFKALLKLSLEDVRPWTSLLYYIEYGHLHTVSQKLLIAHLLALIPPLALLLIFVMPKKERLYGDAKWASRFDLHKAGLYSQQGILLGHKHKKPLLLNGQQHILVSAPTGAGKGVSFVLPNLLSWDQSAVVLDIKRENFEITSGFQIKTWATLLSF